MLWPSLTTQRHQRNGSSTGATHASVPSKTASHSPRVFVLKIAAKRSFIAGHCDLSIWNGPEKRELSLVLPPMVMAMVLVLAVVMMGREISKGPPMSRPTGVVPAPPAATRVMG